MNKIQLEVFRLDLSVSNDSYYEQISISSKSNETLLELLIRYRDEYDPSLSFDKNCRLGLCYSCRMKVNGKPLLACQSNVNDLVEKYGTAIKLEPIKSDHAVKDLISNPELATQYKKIEK